VRAVFPQAGWRAPKGFDGVAKHRRVLMTTMPDAGRWHWANAAAWAVGMPVIFAGMDLVLLWPGPASLQIVTIYLVYAVAGVAVGVIHGRVLLDLLMRSMNASSA
jgi:hypothetical protein